MPLHWTPPLEGVTCCMFSLKRPERSERPTGTPRSQTRKSSGHSVAKRATSTLALTFAILLALNALLSWILTPYGSKTNLAWHDYRELTALDTIVVGSSYAQNSIDPGILDATLGSQTFNLGTPDQSLDNSYVALQSAIDDWHIRRAILCMEYDTLFNEPVAQSEISFISYKQQREPLYQVLRDEFSLMSSDYFFSRHYSLTCLFPWAYNHVPITPESIANNIDNRLKGDIHATASNYAQQTDDESWDYKNGFIGLNSTLHGACTHRYNYAPYKDKEINANTWWSLQRILDLCASNGVALYIVAPPTNVSTLIANGQTYPERMGAVRERATQGGAIFFDLNLAKPETPALDGNELSDLTHLTAAGAAKTSEALAGLIRDAEAGIDTSGSFYSYDDDAWNDYLDSIQYVGSVDFTVTRDNGNTIVEAKAISGPTSTVMYQFETRSPQGGSWTVARTWALSPSFDLRLNETKSIEVRVSARTLQYGNVVKWVKGIVSR